MNMMPRLFLRGAQNIGNAHAMSLRSQTTDGSEWAPALRRIFVAIFSALTGICAAMSTGCTPALYVVGAPIYVVGSAVEAGRTQGAAGTGDARAELASRLPCESDNLDTYATGVIDLALGPDGASVFSAHLDEDRDGDGRFDGGIKQWSLPDLRPIGFFGVPHKVIRIAVDPQGRYLIAIGVDDDFNAWIMRWDLRTRKNKTVLVSGSSFRLVDALAVAQDGMTAVTGTSDGKIQVWHIPTLDKVGNHSFPGGIQATTISPRGGQYLISGRSGIELRNLATGEIERRIETARRVALTADKRRFVEAPVPIAGTNEKLRLETSRREVYGTEYPQIAHLRYLPNGRHFVALADIATPLSNSTPATIYDSGSGSIVAELNLGPGDECGSLNVCMRSLDVSNDGTHVYVGKTDGTVEVWDWRNRQRVRSLRIQKHEHHPNMVVASVPGHEQLVVGSQPEFVSHGRATMVGSLLGVGGGTHWEPAMLALFDVRSGKELARTSAALCSGNRPNQRSGPKLTSEAQ